MNTAQQAPPNDLGQPGIAPRTPPPAAPVVSGASTSFRPVLEALPVLDIHVETDDPVGIEPDEHVGSVLRGAVAGALKRAVCVMDHRTCEDCLLRFGCSYPNVFQPQPDNTFLYSGLQTPSPPWILVLPQVESPRTTLPPAPTRWTARLVGAGIRQAGHVVLAILDACRNGLGRKRIPVDVRRLTLGAPGHPAEQNLSPSAPVWPSPAPSGTVAAYLDTLAVPPPPHVHVVRLQTPMRLVRGGSLCVELDVEAFVRAVLRRLGTLAEVHAHVKIPEAARRAVLNHLSGEISLLAVRSTWHDQARYSGRQHQWMKFGGVTGGMVIRDDAGLLHPLLAAGTLLHAGKNASFGMGRYELETYRASAVSSDDPESLLFSGNSGRQAHG